MPKKLRDKRKRDKSRSFKYKKIRKKICLFCTDNKEVIDYKNMIKLRRFVSERGKILSSKTTGCCAKHQRKITTAIKRARSIALLPYVIK